MLPEDLREDEPPCGHVSRHRRTHHGLIVLCQALLPALNHTLGSNTTLVISSSIVFPNNFVGDRCSHERWWIIQATSPKPFRTFFSSGSSPDRSPHPGKRLHPRTSALTYLDLPTGCSCTLIWLESLSRGTWQQGVGEHLPGCPSSAGSARCHSRSPAPIALCQQSAPSLSWLHESHAQGVVRTDKMVVRSPPLQMGQQLGSLLRSGPGPSCQSRHAMAHGQIHPLDKRRVQSSREA
jgi:hypothetical protein